LNLQGDKDNKETGQRTVADLCGQEMLNISEVATQLLVYQGLCPMNKPISPIYHKAIRIFLTDTNTEI
jgi:hypothetical protein